METLWGKSIFRDWRFQKGILSPISVKIPSSARFNPSFWITCCQLQWLSPAFVYLKRSNPRREQVFHLTARAALMCWHGSWLFLCIHPPNSCFFFSLSLPVSLHHLTVFTFPYSTSLVCLCCLYRSFRGTNVRRTVEHPVSLCIFSLLFLFFLSLLL